MSSVGRGTVESSRTGSNSTALPTPGAAACPGTPLQIVNANINKMREAEDKMDPASLLGASKEMRPTEQVGGRGVLPELCPETPQGEG